MRRWVSCLLLAVLLTSAAWAEQVYIRNKPFKGTVAGTGQQTTVDLQSLVTALGYQLNEVEGNLVVTSPDETAALPEGATGTGQIYFQGKALGAADQGGDTMVPLIPTAQALGAIARINKDMGSIDVNLPVGQRTASPPSTPSTASTSSPTSFTGGGGFKVIHYYADW